MYYIEKDGDKINIKLIAFKIIWWNRPQWKVMFDPWLEGQVGALHFSGQKKRTLETETAIAHDPNSRVYSFHASEQQ